MTGHRLIFEGLDSTTNQYGTTMLVSIHLLTDFIGFGIRCGVSLNFSAYIKGSADAITSTIQYRETKFKS